MFWYSVILHNLTTIVEHTINEKYKIKTYLKNAIHSQSQSHKN
jgi:hypothetical protein